ncbi:hypothetical protein PUV54_12455 [Hyphococcus flavus]|uniref:Uncharacterized protein n=1 Tax=Hyphococcus flavus TaxID=1866326 RepID=A0AAF0CEV7_9PROT|nr:hypothetical protein [Hyphococcus flavus]WDI30764.1 hypothetical protein PUV54_12455 [Hyphococcus flavus]
MFRLILLSVIFSVFACSVSSEQREYEERVELLKSLASIAPTAFDDGYIIEFHPNTYKDNMPILLNHFIGDNVHVSEITKDEIETKVADLKKAEKFIAEKSDKLEFSSNEEQLKALSPPITQALEYVSRFLPVSGLDEFPTRFAAIAYFNSHTAVSDIVTEDLINWARYFCHWENQSLRSGTPLENLAAYQSQPGLYPNFVENLRDYVEKNMTQYARQNTGKIRLRVPLGNYENGGFELPTLKDGLARLSQGVDAGQHETGEYLLRPDRILTRSSSWAGKDYCSATSIEYHDILNLPKARLNEKHSVIYNIAGPESWVGRISRLQMSENAARQLIQSGRQYIYIDIFLKNISPAGREPLIISRKQYGRSEYYHYAVLDAEIIAVGYYDSNRGRIRTGGGLANYGGGTREVDKLGDVVQFVQP